MNNTNPEPYTDRHPQQSPEDGGPAAWSAKETISEAARATAAAADDLTKGIEDVANDVTHSAQAITKRAADSAKEVYHTAKLKAEDTLATSKAYVRRYPFPVILGAVAVGAALGCALVMARRRPTFGERYAEEPMAAVRAAVLGALAPVTHRMHQGYDSARDGAARAVDRIHQYGTSCGGDSLSHRIGRIGNNLKFW